MRTFAADARPMGQFPKTSHSLVEAPIADLRLLCSRGRKGQTHETNSKYFWGIRSFVLLSVNEDWWIMKLILWIN